MSIKTKAIQDFYLPVLGYTEFTIDLERSLALIRLFLHRISILLTVIICNEETSSCLS